MSVEGRTGKSVVNAKVSLFFTVATFLLSFISRKLFLDGLGDQVMGMRSTLGTVLNMLSLSELGIGSAIAVSLYKPLAEKNYDEINEIVSLQGWLYTRVFAFVTFGVLALMFFIPGMFAEMQAPLAYAYFTVIVFYVGTMLSYTVNYKTIVLSADQKGYKIAMIMSSATLLKGIIQMLILYSLENPYIYWLAMDLILALVGVFVLDRVTRREYPWLKISKNKGYIYYKKYPQILRYTGQLFVHNVSGFILTNTAPWLLFSLVNLSIVVHYENYKNLIVNIKAGILALFSNVDAAVASMIVEGNQKKCYDFFWEMLALKYFIGGIGAFGFFMFSSPFIRLWLDREDYIFPLSTMILLSLLAYVEYTRKAVDSYIGGYKLFSDIWAPAVEGLINVGAAFALGSIFKWRIDGILLGTYISLFLIVRLWKPYLLFSRGFEISVRHYWSNMLKFPILTILLIAGSYYGIERLELDMSSSYWHLISHAAWITLVYTLVLFIAFYACSDGFRKMSKRVWCLAEPKLSAIYRLAMRWQR